MTQFESIVITEIASDMEKTFLETVVTVYLYKEIYNIVSANGKCDIKTEVCNTNDGMVTPMTTSNTND